MVATCFVMLLALTACSVVSAQFGGGQLRVDGGADVFLPPLQQSLTAELHFVKKVCKPDEDQFNEIHRAGIAAVADLAESYRDLQRRRENPSVWPDPNLTIAFWLYQSIKKVMPEEVTRDYQNEILARKRAYHAANVTLMVQLVNDQVMLDADQRLKVYDALEQAWQPEWSYGQTMFLYPQHAVVPGKEILEPHLSDLQQTLWSYRVKRPTIRLSWQSHLEFLAFFVDLDPFDPPDRDEESDSSIIPQAEDQEQ